VKIKMGQRNDKDTIGWKKEQKELEAKVKKFNKKQKKLDNKK